MAERHTSRNAPTGRHDLGAQDPARIRNVVLVGPPGGGKTTLVEALLLHTGALSRAGTVEDGTTVSDHEEFERAHHRSASLAVVPLVHRRTKINLLDTPGYADFAGEVHAGYRAADAALFVVPADAATDGTLDDATRLLARDCLDAEVPSAVVVTKLDHARADLAAVVGALRETFGERVMPLFEPVREGERITGLQHLLAPGSASPEQAAAHDRLVEAIVEEAEDEALMEAYLDGEEVAESALVADVDAAMSHRVFHPLLPVCATAGVGLGELLDLVVAGFPAPAERRVPDAFTPEGRAVAAQAADPDGPLVAEVVSTSSDPYVGRVSVVRVFSGTLRPDVPLHVSGHAASFLGADHGHEDHDEDERSGPLSYPFGGQLVPAAEIVAGDIGCVSRLSAETGDTVSSPEEPRVLRPWSMPDPQLPVAIEAETRSDEDKLSEALTRLAAEDPSLRVERNAETHQVVLWVLGEAHADLALDRLRSRYGVQVVERDLVVPLRETLAGPATGHGRHVKQSGGHGQYAVCDVEVEPLPAGGGFEFADRVVGGAVPRQFIGSVEKGVQAQMARGTRLGYPMVDLKVTLVDGKSHSVDSSDMAFQTAGGLALREAAEAAGVVVLEPYDKVAVLVQDSLVGETMSDLSARRGRLLGTDQVGDGRTRVLALVPQTELVRYAIDLRAATHGAGTFTREFAHYEPMPEELAGGVSSRR
ncbi:elongation factor G-like protein EF-G2 [Nocardioides campestrisoli]|uniref:elongation factor G-like protein EF-G2 n=1 Tax=Nocardioides campestrisoli TaxID=2736757 RepID=UPI0015E76A25|nr:elongation factor G-like protein EF-G2 [Nocardioides campestrisoli]